MKTASEHVIEFLNNPADSNWPDPQMQRHTRRSSARSCTYWLITAAILIGGLALGSQSMAQSVLIDDWQTAHRVNSTGDSSWQQTGGSFAENQGFILGGWRNVYASVDQVTSDNQTSSVSGANERNSAFNNEAGTTGVARVFWDGRQTYITDSYFGAPGLFDSLDDDPLTDYLDGNNNLVADLVTPPATTPANPTLRSGGSIDPVGLRFGGDDGVNLLNACADGSNGALSLLLNEPDAAASSYTVQVDIFTDGSNWSRGTIVVNQGDGTQIRSLDFPVGTPGDPGFVPGDFVTQGQNNTQGATFSSVGAVVLSVFTEDPDVDTRFGTPVLTGCGFDFGDAPQSFRTLAVFTGAASTGDPETRTFRGPHHLIGGPFLGLGLNDTDAEPDGQPSPGADGDAGDEEALEDPPVFFADFIVAGDISEPIDGAQLAECAGLVMDPEDNTLNVGPNTYCVALQVSNPTAEWAQVVGWIDFRGNGAFDNRCGGSISGDGGVTVDTRNGKVVYPSSLRSCERSASRVFIGDLSTVTGSGATGETALRNAGENPSGLSCATGGAFTSNAVGSALDQDNNWTGGNIPPGCEGVVVLTWDLDDIIQQELSGTSILTAEQTFSRFRISTDPASSGATGCGFFQITGPTPYCYAGDGEVEDHSLEAGTVPISLGSFDSRYTASGLEVTWTTVSETENIGFHIWGDTGSDVRVLTEEMVPSTANDIAQPQTYRIVLPGIQRGEFESLAVTGIDIRGQEEFYGFFSIGEEHGRYSEADLIDWPSITQAATERMSLMGIVQNEGMLSREAAGPIHALDLAVTQPGMQRITYEELAAAGLDLSGANPFTIAVTLNGRGVPRVVTLPGQDRFESSRFARVTDSRPPRFGPGSAIEFWGEEPKLPDGLYVEKHVYRVSIDREQAVEAETIRTRPLLTRSAGAPDTVPQAVRVMEHNLYNPFNRNPNPFFVTRLVANRSNDRRAFNIEVDSFADTERTARVQVRVAGATDLPVSPDHHVRIKVNGEVVTDYFFDGAVSRLVEAEIPAGLLRHGSNEVMVIAAGETAAHLDEMFLGEVILTYQRQPVAEENRLFVRGLGEEWTAVEARSLNAGAEGVLGFGWDGQRLFQVAVRESGVAAHHMPTLGQADAEYWMSSAQALHVPSVVGSVGANDVLDGVDGVDFVIITHPAFMPASAGETHPLNDFIALRQSEGWNVGLFDILSIQQHFGGGMPLPGAVTRFLRAADEVLAFEHVLLVGDGNYDHLDHFGLGGMSFIPTIYRATSEIQHTPSDALLADLNGNGLPDKAVGRWPVRTLEDLQATVTKTQDWQNNASEIQGALWLTDRQDRQMSSFSAQTSRMMSPLVNAGWPDDRLDQVIFEDVGGAANARQILINALEEGRAVTGFSGHAAPTMWTWEGLLVPTDVRKINNVGRPTLIGTLSCYTSYAVSPYTNTIAHRMMNGYMLDEHGNAIPGAANGAVAIHGASTLSSLAQNEIVARRVLENQLAGMTLGEAIEEARLNGWERGLRDQVINWTLLGDPTLRLQR